MDEVSACPPGNQIGQGGKRRGAPRGRGRPRHGFLVGAHGALTTYICWEVVVDDTGGWLRGFVARLRTDLDPDVDALACGHGAGARVLERHRGLQ